MHDGSTGWMPAFSKLWQTAAPLLGLAVMSFTYLVFDVYPQVKSFKAIRSTPAFWALWLVFGFLDTIAFGLIDHSARNQIAALFDSPTLAVAAVQFLSTVGVYSILQSFTLNFAGHKVVDLEKLVAIFRASALEAVLAKKTLNDRKRARWVAGELRDIYKFNPQALGEDYGQLMILAAHSHEQIKKELDHYMKSEGLERDTLLNELTLRMCLIDIDMASRVRWKRSTESQKP